MTKPKALIIAEKKSLADVYRQAIHQYGQTFPFDYEVLQFQGNVVGLKEPDQINPAWKKWSLKDLPLLPEKFEYVPIKPQKGDDRRTAQYKKRGYQYFQEAKKQLSSGRYAVVVNGCDPDREGQSIFDKFMLLMPKKVQNLPQKRLWVGDMQVETSVQYLRNPLDNKDPEYVNFGHEAMGRGIMDWLLGINGSRAFTLEFKARPAIHIGRGMTAILAIVAQRNREIANFQSHPYWQLKLMAGLGNGQELTTRLIQAKAEKLLNFTDFEAAQDVEKQVRPGPAVVTESSQGKGKIALRRSPKYFNTSDLIAYLSSPTYRCSGQSVTAALQHLYERKITTYPRTAGREMTPQRAENLEQILAVAQKVPALNERLRQLEITPAMVTKLAQNRYYVKPLSQKTGHDCLTFTGKEFDYEKLNHVEQLVVSAIAFRLLLSVLPPEKHRQEKIILKVQDYRFLAQANSLVDSGWTAYIPNFKGNYQQLPSLAPGMVLPVTKTELEEKQTTPPKPYTTATLLKAMENAGRLTSKAKLRQALKDHGIGTAATRQILIDKNEQLGYWTIDKKSRIIKLTDSGNRIIELLKDNPLVKVDLTAQWEEKLAEVSSGNLSLSDFSEIAKKEASAIVAQIIGSQTESFRQEEPAQVIASCPLCGGQIQQNGHAYKCRNYGQEAGCNFYLGRYPSWLKGNELQLREVLSLINTGKSSFLKMYSPKKRRNFQARFTLNLAEKKIDFEFKPRKQILAKEIGICPLDGGKILESDKQYVCQNHRVQRDQSGHWQESGCPFKVFKTMLGTKITMADMQAMLNQGQTEVKEFTGKKHQLFRARLIFDENQGRTTFRFEN
ncbi:DNA topoisomerase [Ligilactobacillus equi]